MTAGGLEVIDALRQMRVGNVVHTLQFHDDLLLDHQVGHVFAHVLPFVANWRRNLSLGAHTTKRKLPKQGSFIDLLQESDTQHIGNFEGGANYGLCQI